MIRGVAIVALIAIALAASSVDAHTNSRLKGVRRIGRTTAVSSSVSSMHVTCTADAMARAMEQARAGNGDWFDTLKSGLSTAANAVGDVAVVVGKGVATGAVAVADVTVEGAKKVADGAVVVANAVNVVKAWECNRCAKCSVYATDLASKVVRTLLETATTEALGGSVCIGFDASVTLLCSAICTPIPVPGLCPIVCPPMVIFGHAKCSGIVSDIIKEITTNPSLQAKVRSKQLVVTDVKTLSTDHICRVLELCPLTRTDCDASSTAAPTTARPPAPTHAKAAVPPRK